MSWKLWDQISEWIYIYSTVAGLIILAISLLIGSEETVNWLVSSIWSLILLGPLAFLFLAYTLLFIVKLIQKIPV